MVTAWALPSHFAGVTQELEFPSSTESDPASLGMHTLSCSCWLNVPSLQRHWGITTFHPVVRAGQSSLKNLTVNPLVNKSWANFNAYFFLCGRNVRTRAMKAEKQMNFILQTVLFAGPWGVLHSVSLPGADQLGNTSRWVEERAGGCQDLQGCFCGAICPMINLPQALPLGVC